jgi:hypothetical protein
VTDFVFLPNPNLLFVGKDGVLTSEAWRALRGLQLNLQGQIDDLEQVVADIVALNTDVTALDESKADKSLLVLGSGSVIRVGGTDLSQQVVFQLVNDISFPGPGLVYGTDSAGAKGWIPFSNLNHNELNGLQGGTTDEYYHLTATQHTPIAQIGDLADPAADSVLFWNNTTNQYAYSGFSADAQLLLADSDVPRIGTPNTWDDTQTVYNASGGRFEMDGPQLPVRGFDFLTEGVLRWRFVCGGPAESGGNAGSNFACIAYDDAGAALGSAYTIGRSTRIVSFTMTPNVAGTDLALITQTITNGDTTHAPSADIVFDTIAGLSGVYDPIGAAATAEANANAYTDTEIAGLSSVYQPLDATLTALAGQNWAANALPIGTGADTVSQVAFAANTFPARASTGDLVAKTITDGALSAVGGSGGTAGWLRGDGTVTSQLETVGSEQSLTLRAYASLTRLAAERYNGTVGTPTAILTGQNLFAFTMRGYNGSALVESGGIQFSSTENWGVGAHGMQCIIRTTANGSASPSTRWVFTHDGNCNPSSDNLYSFGTSSLRVASDHVVQRNTSGAEYHTGEQAVSLTANTDNFAVNSTTRVLRIGSNNNYNLTGLTGGAAGRRLTLLNVSAFTITLTHDATSTAANRFFCPNNTNVAVRQNGSAEIIYDSTSSRWRVIGA